jgi:pentatricopeptide repeat protein
VGNVPEQSWPGGEEGRGADLPEDLAQLASFVDPVEAGGAQQALEERGIACWSVDQVANPIAPGIAAAVALCVRSGDLDRARGVLEELEREHVEPDLDLPSLGFTGAASELAELPARPVPGLGWVQPAAGDRWWVLCDRGACYATLRVLGSAGDVTTRDAAWVFDSPRRGARVLVRPVGSDELLGVLHLAGEREGILEDPRGAPLTELRWSGRSWDDAEGEWLIVQHNASTPSRVQARLELDPRATALAELPLLLALQWYLASGVGPGARTG